MIIRNYKRIERERDQTEKIVQSDGPEGKGWKKRERKRVGKRWEREKGRVTLWRHNTIVAPSLIVIDSLQRKSDHLIDLPFEREKERESLTNNRRRLSISTHANKDNEAIETLPSQPFAAGFCRSSFHLSLHFVDTLEMWKETKEPKRMEVNEIGTSEIVWKRYEITIMRKKGAS